MYALGLSVQVKGRLLPAARGTISKNSTAKWGLSKYHMSYSLNS